MANLNLRSTEDQEDDRPRGDKSNYDPEQEIPDPEEVERDIEREEEEYGDEDQETGRKIA
jgi:hypothetical protein